MVNNQHIKRNLTLFGFFSLTASMVLTVYEYPTFATSYSSLFLKVYSGSFQLPYVLLKWLPLTVGTITAVASLAGFLILLEKDGDLQLFSSNGFKLLLDL